MKKSLIPLLLLPVCIIASANLFSQSKAQIHIKKNQNGVESEETREIQLQEGQNIQDILSEMGILDEFGQLKPGQDMEIRIDKSEGDNNFQNLEFLFSPEGSPSWSLPEFAPAPPMENRPFLGVMLRENEGDTKGEQIGAVISEVVPGSSAEQAGLLAGDVIIQIEKTEINRIDDVIRYVQSQQKGDKVEVTVLRNNKKKKVKAVLGEKAMEPMVPFGMPTEPGAPRYNFRFGPDSITIYCPSIPNCILPNDSMKICQPFSWNGNGLAIKETAFLGVTPMDGETSSGVRVRIEEESSAEKMGLKDGDVIKQINQISVNSFDELSDAISKSKPGEIVNLVIEREGKEKEISGEIGKRSISGFDDFRIFHDFKGMDEGGNYTYDYEFDMDEKDVEQRMEELLQELDSQQSRIEEERSRIEGELDRLNRPGDSVTIKIRIEEITQEEVARVNSNASPKLANTNNLDILQISFFPNPSDGVLNLNFATSDKGPIKVILYSNEGEVVYLEERASFDGNYNNTIDISDEPNGTYFLQIMQGTKTYSKKIVKGL